MGKSMINKLLVVKWVDTSGVSVITNFNTVWPIHSVQQCTK